MEIRISCIIKVSGRGLMPGNPGARSQRADLNQRLNPREKGFYATANGEVREAS
jgi:hypothetical protein